MVTTYEPRTVMTPSSASPSAPPRRSSRLVLVVAAVLAVVLAAFGGYALAGGFSTSEGQTVSDNVLQAWRTGDVDDMKAAYAPTVEFVMDDASSTLTREQLRANIQTNLTMAGLWDEPDAVQQIGPVAEYTDGDGDLYVTSMVDVNGSPMSGFYRVRDGKVISHVFLTVRDYEPAR